TFSLFLSVSAPTDIYTLSLHDALPICTQQAYNDLLDAQIEEQEKTNELWQARLAQFNDALNAIEMQASIYSQRTSMLSQIYDDRSEEHTSELQSRFDLVCRLLLEQKKH